MFFTGSAPFMKDRPIRVLPYIRDCGHHADSKSLVAKAFRHGFYWLTAHADVEDLVSRCDGYQKFAREAHVSAQ